MLLGSSQIEWSFFLPIKILQFGFMNKRTALTLNKNLNKLARIQDKNGFWQWASYSKARCTGEALATIIGIESRPNHSVQSKTIFSGLSWLMESQNADGRFDECNYTNGICSIALAESLQVGFYSQELLLAARHAAKFLLQEQQFEGGYFATTSNFQTENPRQINNLATIWCIIALRSLKSAGIETLKIQNTLLRYRLI